MTHQEDQSSELAHNPLLKQARTLFTGKHADPRLVERIEQRDTTASTRAMILTHRRDTNISCTGNYAVDISFLGWQIALLQFQYDWDRYALEVQNGRPRARRLRARMGAESAGGR